MLEKSVFTNESLIEEIKNNYGLDVKEINKIPRGSANIYEIKTNKKDYILKEFQSCYDSETVFKEIEVINHLKEKGL